MIRLENWAVVSPFQSPYIAPERHTWHFTGSVVDHPRLGGANITTSPIVKIREENGEMIATTYTGSEYILGEVNPDYEKEYPNAHERLLTTIK